MNEEDEDFSTAVAATLLILTVIVTISAGLCDGGRMTSRTS